ncbi:putative methyltransferase-domain-containing protein [Pelagophyceae sp. CCMP2097]|nr:putative methyltransferase-domain-containing protein [Pelagophyceae sp. CCMP2097]
MASAPEQGSFRERFELRSLRLDAQSTLELEQEPPPDLMDEGDVPLGGTGGTIWRAGEELARRLFADETLRGLFFGRRVLELGAGTGILGLSCAALGATSVLTDVADALPLLRRNVQRNSWVQTLNGATVLAAQLDWTAPRFEVVGAVSALGVAQVLVASDVCYHASLVPPLVSTMRAALQAMGPDALALVACVKHEPMAFSALLEGLRQQHHVEHYRRQDDGLEVFVVSHAAKPWRAPATGAAAQTPAIVSFHG